MATRLHELLAVEGQLRTQAESCRKDLTNTFEKKRHHFEEKLVTFKSSKEGEPDKVESQLALQSSVDAEIAWISEKIGAALDAGHQIDKANQTAKTDLVLDSGTVLMHDVPTTSLLRMEHRVIELRDFIKAIPTLDPAKGFETDPAQRQGVFKARDVTKTRTQKIQKHVVVVQPTKEHPAQTAVVNEDVPVGTILEQEWSSLITVATKGDMLDRVEALLRAIKKARARSNDVEIDVKQNKIGTLLLGYVFSGKLP